MVEIEEARRRVTIGVIQITTIKSSPDDHLIPGPNGSDLLAYRRGSCGEHGGPTIGDRIVNCTIIKIVDPVGPSPDDHPVISPNSSLIHTRRGGSGGADGCPTVRGWIVDSSIRLIDVQTAPPNNHAASCPNRRLLVAGGGKRSVDPLLPAICCGDGADFYITGIQKRHIFCGRHHQAAARDATLVGPAKFVAAAPQASWVDPTAPDAMLPLCTALEPN